MNIEAERQAVIAHVHELVDCGCNYKLEALDDIYDEDLIIIMVQEDGSVVTFNKVENMEMFANKLKNNEPPLNRSMEWKHIDIKGDYANAVVEREVDFFGKTNNIYFSLFLKKYGAVWRVYRENAFVVT